MKTVFCTGCQKNLTVDEVALNQRLLGMQIGVFHCTDCLAQKLHISPSNLEKLILRFKEMGCVYFTRLMEDGPVEKEDDDL